MWTRHLAKYSAVISSAYFGDLILCEPLTQHLTHNSRQKSSRQIWIGSIGARTYAGRKQIGIGADTDVVDAYRVHHRLDAFHKFSQRTGEVRPHPDDAPGIDTTLA